MDDVQLNVQILLQVLQIVAIVGGGGVVAFRLGRVTQRVEMSLDTQNKAISGLQDDVKELNRVVTSVALQGQRIDTLGARIDLLDKRYEEIRHGEGFVFPLMHGKAPQKS